MPSFQDIKFALYDIPGIDGKNYKGEELALCMHGLMPTDVDFKHNPAYYSTIGGRRNSADEEFKRRAHVVAFFVPQGVVGDSAVMDRLAECLYQITVQHKRKAIVIISHADEIPGEEERKQVMEDVCQALSIDNSSVFFLENYVNSKVKQFHVDKNVLRILLAMICRADDFLCFNKLNPIICPFPANGMTSTTIPSTPPSPKVRSETPTNERSRSASNSTSTSTTPSPKSTPKSAASKPAPAPAKPKSAPKQDFFEDFIEKLPENLRDRMKLTLEEEAIEDEETVKAMTADDWKSAGFKIGEVKKIEKALAE
jgi:hypothetical protein